MARAGGQSTAAGVSFQALAIARAIIDAHQGRLDFVRAEVPPHADFGQAELLRVDVDDFVTQSSGVRVYHQAKSNAPGGGNWTLNKLLKEEILQSFARQLAADPLAECCLVTPADCPLLDKIAGQARHAEGIDEFRNNLNVEQRQLVAEASVRLGVDELRLYGLLQRCSLERRTAEQIRKEIEALASVLFADPKAASECLFSMAMRAMETGESLDSAVIKVHFSESSVFGKPEATEAQLLSAVKEASSRLRGVGKEIAGVHVLQPTVEQLLAWAGKQDSAKPTVAALLDQAGSGKTVAMSVLLERLERTGFVVLGIKVDGLAFSSQGELASVMGLPDSIPSVLQSLKTAGHKVALLIDQVDALSSAMSRESSAISIVLDVVARIAGLQIPIVLACRSFDWKYDYRLSDLRAKNPTIFTLPELTDEQLRDLLSVCSLTPTDLHPLTVKVIRCPLRLRVLVEVIQTHRQSDPSWGPGSAVYTLQTLYQDFWSLKMSKAMSDGVASAECEAVVVKLAQTMHSSEHLSVPEAVVADSRAARDWLVSEDVLSLHGKVLSFFHQTFFDFVFARRFVGDGESLVDHLLASDQGLFYRPMVRQVLEYLRDSSPQRYIAELKGILDNGGIRKHLRWLAIALLGQHRDPKPEELDSLEQDLAKDDTRRRVLGCLRGNAAWFDLLTVRRFDRWLRTLPEAGSGPIVWYLHHVLPERQKEISALVFPHVGESEFWNNQIAFCLAEIKTGWADCSADLLCAILSDPFTKPQAEHGWWASALESLAKSLPRRACEAVSVILRRFEERWAKTDDEGADSLVPKLQGEPPRLPTADEFTDAMNILATSVPEKFLKHVLPWTLAAMGNSCYSYNDRSFRDSWEYWSTEDLLRDNPSGRLLSAIGKAAKELAKADASRLRVLVPDMLRDQYVPMQVIVAEAYEGNPVEFAGDAAVFLVSDPRRLRLGCGGSGAWRTTRLMRVCCPYWSQEDFLQVESAVLAMEGYPAKTVNDLRWRGTTHLVLLQALDRERLSSDALNRLGQLERKFPGYRQLPPQDTEMHFVGAPISQDSMKRMDDEAWIGAMRKHIKGWDSHCLPDDPQGGRVELSRSLQAAAKEQPDRFYALAVDRIDANFHADYVGAIIAGIAEATVPVHLLERLVREFLPQLEKDHIRTVASAIGKYAGKSIPLLLRELLECWALHAPDPLIEANPSEGENSGQEDDDRLLTVGINTDRGGALWALAAILFKADPPRRAEYLDVAEKVVADPSAAVRAVCIQFLQYAIPADPMRACDLFKRLIGKETPLLRERGTYDFVYYSLPRHAKETLWAVMLMLTDVQHPKAQEAGAKLACLAALDYSVAAALRDLCLGGSVAMRKGAAAVYSANVVQARVGQESRERLRLLMDDEDAEVRREATAFLRRIDASCLREMSDLVRAWARTKALEEGAENAAHMFEDNPVVEPELTLDVAQRLIDLLGREIANRQNRHGMISYHLTPAILNVYHRSGDSGTRRWAMDLFEKLEELGCPEVQAAMESTDRL